MRAYIRGDVADEVYSINGCILYKWMYIGGDVADVLGAFEAWGAVCRHSKGRPWLQSGLLYKWMYTL